MKKLILALTAVLFGMSSANAQHYRGFVDANLSIPTVKMNGGTLSYSDAIGFAMGLTTSHGVQLKNFFVGAGIGVFYHFGCEYSSPIPLFINGRYDFFNIHKANLFIDCKLGYFMNHSGEVSFNSTEVFYFDDYYVDDLYFESEFKGNKLFFNPSVGVRLRCSNTCGFNIAIGYLPMSMKLTNLTYAANADSYIGRKFTDHRLSLTIGFEF